MTGQPPPSSSGSHKAAAIALVIVSVIAAILVYGAFIPSYADISNCISGGGGSSRCGGGTGAGIAGVILVGGIVGAAKVWRGK